MRGSPETRPYNSLPRGQDVSNYPSLAVHQTNAKNTSRSPSPSKPPRKHSPAKRSHSEDVYNERDKSSEPKPEEVKRSPRINPLIKYASERKPRQDSESDASNSDKENDLISAKTKRKLMHTRSENLESKRCLEVTAKVESAKTFEKRVSFSNDTEQGEQTVQKDDVPVELCDIEPISGTVFRKVTVRRRRQEMRKMPATDAGDACFIIRNSFQLYCCI